MTHGREQIPARVAVVMDITAYGALFAGWNLLGNLSGV